MSFEIGHQSIDHHHEELLNIDTMLDKAIRSNQRSNLEPLIVFLEQYSNEHFKEEEDLMLSHDFSGYALHKAEHEMFASFVKECRLMYATNRPTAHIIFLIRRIVDQLIRHIKTVDATMKYITEEKQ
jgi:hemerythrin